MRPFIISIKNKIMKKTILIIIIFFININFIYSQCFTNSNIGVVHCVAKKTDNTLWVWGGGYNGQLCNNGQGDSLTPIQITTSSPVIKVAAAQSTSYFITQNGSLWGSGGNQFGALGIGASPIKSQVFVQIGTSTIWKDIAPSSDFTLAIKTNNTLWA